MKIKSAALSIVVALSLTACTPAATETVEPFEGLTIVASTNVWGDIASSVGGDLVQVVSIVDNFAQDPHSYEASARDQLAVNNADLIVANGGGYDPFMDTLAKAANNESIIYAYLPDELAKEEEHSTEEDDHSAEGDDHSHDHDHGNEHVWYDFHVVADFATRLSAELVKLDSTNASGYEQNLAQFLSEIAILEDRVAVLSVSLQGRTVISSEPVADYLLTELGLANITPSSFSQAIEEELDVSPKDLLEIQTLIGNGQVDLFVVNQQTGSAQIDALVSLAEENSIKTVEMSELLPEGIRYFEWMDLNIAAIEAALR